MPIIVHHAGFGDKNEETLRGHNRDYLYPIRALRTRDKSITLMCSAYIIITARCPPNIWNNAQLAKSFGILNTQPRQLGLDNLERTKLSVRLNILMTNKWSYLRYGICPSATPSLNIMRLSGQLEGHRVAQEELNRRSTGR